MKKILKNVLLGLIALAFLGLASTTIYMQQNTYRAEKSAIALLKGKNVNQTNAVTIFKGKPHQAAFIFYTGALVEPSSYAFLGKELSAQGYSTYIIHSPLNLPILSKQTALKVIKTEGLKIEQVYLGGHSLGGVVAAANAAQLEGVKGLIFLASYPSDETDLSNRQLAVLSLTASQDKILNWQKFQTAKKRLPINTDYQRIEGGNHSGFGLYGQQANDGQASLSNSDQQKEIVRRILAFVQQN